MLQGHKPPLKSGHQHPYPSLKLAKRLVRPEVGWSRGSFQSKVSSSKDDAVAVATHAHVHAKGVCCLFR